jgi:hypothetical protein
MKMKKNQSVNILYAHNEDTSNGGNVKRMEFALNIIKYIEGPCKPCNRIRRHK